jgi:hypothetical protein
MLAAAMRGWDYEEIRAAIIAASQAGWDSERIYRETFRLLLIGDATPADLRQASRNPLRRTGPGGGTSEETRAALEEARQRCAESPVRVHPASGLGETG